METYLGTSWRISVGQRLLLLPGVIREPCFYHWRIFCGARVAED